MPSTIDQIMLSTKIAPNHEDFIITMQHKEEVKTEDDESNFKEFYNSLQHEEGFKMVGEAIHEDFLSNGNFEKHGSMGQPGALDEDYFSLHTVRNSLNIKTEPDDENSPPQQFEELVKIEESETTSVEFVCSPQFVDSDNDQSEVTGKVFVNWPQPLQAITKVIGDPQEAEVRIEQQPSAMCEYGTETPYTCNICGKGFKTEAVMTSHVIQFHPQKLIFKCNVCGKTFFKKSSIKNHIFTHAEKCGVCGKSFLWLSLHMLTHTGEPPHLCDVCEKLFIAIETTNRESSHLISPYQNGLYYCNICGKELRTWQHFTLHLKKHTLTETHLTCVCSTKHGSSNDTQSLMTSTQEGSHKCKNSKLCGKGLAVEDPNHFSITDNSNFIVNDSVTEKTRKCERCGKEFRRWSALRKHLEIHTVNQKAWKNEQQPMSGQNNDQNPCSLCGNGFQSTFELQLHLLTHFKRRPQDCDACVQGFTSKEILLKYLINHMKSSHYDSHAYVIGVLKKKQLIIPGMRKFYTVDNHSSKQSFSQGTTEDLNNEQPHKCDVWPKGIIMKRNISECMMSHIGECPHAREQPCKCGVCEKEITKVGELTKHRSAHIGERHHKRDVCGMDFKRKHNMTKHILPHAGTCSHTCSVYVKGSAQKGHFSDHMLTHTREQPHKCDVCGKEFSRKRHITKHMLTHTRKCRHICGVCGNGFLYMGHLSYHLSYHTRERPHKCGMCGKGFTQKGHLSSHMLTHTGERPHKCGVCEKDFSQKAHLLSHMSVHTGECLYNCGVCGRGFTQKGHLSSHISAHTVKRSPKCGVCKKGFSSNTNLSNHMSTHTGEFVHKCDVCGKGFTFKNTVAEHMFTHTGK